MNWIGFVRSHPGSPSSPKIRNSRGSFACMTLRSGVGRTSHTLNAWVRETDHKIEVKENLRMLLINEMISSIKN